MKILNIKIKKLKSTILFFLIFLCGHIVINSNENDSLLNTLKSRNIEDSISVFNKIILNYFAKSENINAEIYIEKNNRIYNRISDYSHKIDILNTQAVYYSFYDEEKGFEIAIKAKKMSEVTGYQYGKAYAYYNLGYYALNQNNLKAIEYFIKSLNIKENKSDLRALTLSSLGEAYRATGNFQEALKYLIKSEKLYDGVIRTNPSDYNYYNYANLQNSFGIIYRKLNNNNLAIKYYNTYKQISEKIGDKWGIAIALNNIGIINKNINNKNEALSDFYRSVDILRQLSISSLIGNVFLNLGNTYSEMRNQDSAEFYYNKAMDIFQKHKDNSGIGLVITNTADLYIQNKNFKKGIEMYFKALEISKTLNENDRISDIYKLISNAYQNKGDSRKALKYYQLHTDLKDSIYNIAKSEELGMIKAQFELEKKIDDEKRHKEESEKIEKEAKNRSNLLQYIGIIIFLITLFAVIFAFGKFKIKLTLIESMIFVSFLFLFEFILLLLEPLLSGLTNGEPALSILIYGLVAFAFTPLDTYSEQKVRKMVLKD
jgi:tetratricopeptide (TPR) repeat protein